MSNENRYAGLVGRSPLLSVVAAFFLTSSVVVSALSFVVFVSNFDSDGSIVAEVPIEPSVVNGLVATWAGDAEAVNVSVISAVVNDPPRSALNESMASVAISSGAYLLVGIAAAVIFSLLLIGRLRWRILPVVALVSGMLISASSLVSQILMKSSNETVSAFVQQDLGVWTEPGFGVGIDPTVFIAGLVVASTAVLFLISGRLAKEVDGLV